jgi:hypothetical protein
MKWGRTDRLNAARIDSLPERINSSPSWHPMLLIQQDEQGSSVALTMSCPTSNRRLVLTFLHYRFDRWANHWRQQLKNTRQIHLVGYLMPPFPVVSALVNRQRTQRWHFPRHNFNSLGHFRLEQMLTSTFTGAQLDRTIISTINPNSSAPV